eukprot:747547-Pyramimonas_sp.AAC.1
MADAAAAIKNACPEWEHDIPGLVITPPRPVVNKLILNEAYKQLPALSQSLQEQVNAVKLDGKS